MQIGVALSGGGAFASAHIGVLKAFLENNIKIDYISGTSMGAIVGALFASGFSPQEMEKIVKKFDYREITNNYLLNFIYGKTRVVSPAILSLVNQIPDGLISGNMIEHNFNRILKSKNVQDIRDVQIPIAIPAIDIKSGKTIYFVSTKRDLVNTPDCIYYDDVKLSEAVRASMSYPLFFRPKRVKGHPLIDGGIKENLPVNILKQMGANKIIAVNVNGNSGEYAYRNAFDISLRALNIMSDKLKDNQEKNATFTLNIAGNGVQLLDVSKIPYSIKYGYDSANKAMPALLNELYF